MTGGEPGAAAGWGDARQRTVTWWDPVTTADAMATTAGLELMRLVRDGVLPPPPMAQLTNLTLAVVEEGQVQFRSDVDESFANPIGLIHGGLACTLLDSAAGCAVHTTLPAGVGYTSLEIKVSYLRPVPVGATVIATGRCTKPGRRAAFAEASLTTLDGIALATASSTCLVFPLT